MENAEYLVVLSTCPNEEVAGSLAEALVKQNLAACVNIIAGVKSVYKWEGKLENSSEVLLLIKTRREVYCQLETTVKELHPYELPEIIAVPIDQGLPQYLGWIDQEVGSL